MSRRLFGGACGLAVVAAALSSSPGLSEEPAADLAVTSPVALGEALFLHNWARPDGWTLPEPLGDGGDGLGPMFNNVSCVACHRQGGVGGAGGNEHNVQLLNVIIAPQATAAQKKAIIRRAVAIHPGFGPQSLSVLLHRHGFDGADRMEPYDEWRSQLLSLRDSTRVQPGVPDQFTARNGVILQLTERNTTALWGAAQLEWLRRGPGRTARRQIAVKQNGGSRGVTGRIPGSDSGGEGWYGWRGDIASLSDFVRGACAVEVGLNVSTHPQAASPLAAATARGRRQATDALDMTNEQVEAMTNYILSLPRPQQSFPTAPEELANVYQGEQVFSAVGCADCHVPHVAGVEHIYSDLLMHDMGRSLADPMPALPAPVERPRQRRINRSSYYAPPVPLDLSQALEPPASGDTPKTRVTQEWRTPPLWGVADTGPYLHDGRAATLEEAIAEHAGEAQWSVNAYRVLPEEQRSQLLSFLGTLRAPQSSVIVAEENP